MVELGEARIIEGARDLVEHDTQIGGARPVLVAHPYDCIKTAYVAVVREASRSSLACQAGLAIAAQADDQHNRGLLTEAFSHLGEGLRAHDELAVGRCGQVVVDTRRAWARRAEGADLVEQFV